ncbi:hypothetical protein Sango_1934600 [Sesamum angolense]|uniref:RNase H type-1 domain-containing protein n=1 Tax=Sesamum angolense TaxID=2727404 RepID=A0AAE1WDW5_9LAMI|nr:hypothetical protein Sango_1934600 [Sesamum angolense]
MIHTYRENDPSTGDHSQAISFLFSFTPYKGEDERTLEADFGAPTEDAPKVKKRLLHVDGSSPTQGSGAGVVIASPCGEDLEFDIKFVFKASNNEVEYEALVIGMRMTHEVGARHLVAYSDSQLIVKQVDDTYEVKEENMIHYLQQIAELKMGFESFQLIVLGLEES